MSHLVQTKCAKHSQQTALKQLKTHKTTRPSKENVKLPPYQTTYRQKTWTKKTDKS